MLENSQVIKNEPPPPGELTDYKPLENSLVDAAANGHKWLVRKCLSPDEIATLKAQGIAIPEGPVDIAATIKQAVIEAVSFLNKPINVQKGTEPMDPKETAANKDEGQPSGAAAGTETTKMLSDDDWTKISELVDTKISEALAPIKEQISQVSEKSVETAQKAEAAAAAAGESTETAKSLAQSVSAQTELLTKSMGHRPAPAGDGGGGSPTPGSTTQTQKSVWGNSGVTSYISRAANA